MDISVQLDKHSHEPMYVQLYKAIKSMIEKGELKHDEKLPPIRRLSQTLGVNNSTVVNAYNLLQSNGYAYSMAGSGTYVLSKKVNIGKNSSISVFGAAEVNEIRMRNDSINLASSTPDEKLFPINSFKNILNEVLDRDGGLAFSYTEIMGYRPLRECIVDYMKESGVECSIENVQIISGAQQGIDIVAKALLDYGDIIVTENPTYTGAIAVFKSRGANIIGIPINEEGIIIDKLENKLREVSPKFIYVMPNFQNPTGFSYSQNTKEMLLYFADKYDFYIIEDDYLSEICFGEQRPMTLKAMDKNDRVIFIKSFSKIFMPGIRIGFLIVPDAVKSRVLAAKHLSDISTSGFMQRVFDLFIRENMLHSHINDIRQKYYERYKTILNLIDAKLQNVSYYKPMGGIHIWLKLKEGLSSNMLYSECLMSNVVISPGSAFFVDDSDSEFFRLSYASSDIQDISKGIDTIGRIIKNMENKNYYFENVPFL